MESSAAQPLLLWYLFLDKKRLYRLRAEQTLSTNCWRSENRLKKVIHNFIYMKWTFQCSPATTAVWTVKTSEQPFSKVQKNVYNYPLRCIGFMAC